jgi:putative glycosyltransferase (TIGR04372 family)
MIDTNAGLLTIYSVQRSGLRIRLQIIRQTITAKPSLLLTLPLSVVPCLILLILRPIIQIRLGLLRSDRLGHFAMNHEIFLADDKCIPTNKRVSNFDIYFFGHVPVCNTQLGLMWQRRLRIWNNPLLYPCSLILRSSRIFGKHVCGEPTYLDRDVNLSLTRTSPSISFLDHEEVLGNRILEDLGVPSGAQFVCLSVRDSAYTAQLGFGDLSYHDIRNADIDNYLMAADALTERGVYVIRMGKTVSKCFDTPNQMIIDYALSSHRTDLMDVYLAQKCLFAMGTSNGFLALPLLFRRPYLETDLPTLGWIYSYSHSSLSLAKSFFDISSGQNLTLTEILKSPVAFSNRKDTFDASGIQLVDNTPEEIRDAAIEMFDRVNNSITYSMNDRLLQDKFRRVFVSSLNESGTQIHPNFNATYSIDALRSDPRFLN